MSRKLAMFGGGGFRTPLIYEALLQAADLDISEFVLYDPAEDRLRLMNAVTAGLARERGGGPRVTMTTDPEAAADGADLVFCAIRVGGLEGRVIDERVALDRGALGQETTGPGGVAKALRTIPATDAIARIVARRAPDAWFVNFTNPAGVVTESLRDNLGDRVVGVCDTPSDLCDRVARALGREPGELAFDYAGLNHLGWLTGVRDGFGELLPRLLRDDDALGRLTEARLFGVDRLRALGVVPNEYLAYYYFAPRIVERMRAGVTRGQYLLDQQRAFFATAAGDPARAVSAWRAAYRERASTYLAEAEPHEEVRGGGRPVDDHEGGGYGGVAVRFARAVLTGVPSVSVLNVANRAAMPYLPADAVVEVPCAVTTAGPAPLSVAPLPAGARELVEAVKEVERLVIRAARTGSKELAVRALARHPLVSSVDQAHSIFEGYVAGHDPLRERFG